jgi:hypothetical protein
MNQDVHEHDKWVISFISERLRSQRGVNVSGVFLDSNTCSKYTLNVNYAAYASWYNVVNCAGVGPLNVSV